MTNSYFESKEQNAIDPIIKTFEVKKWGRSMFCNKGIELILFLFLFDLMK